jgi:prepilin-type N-terminal cleavage/methylation domain-containing protein/prepilin-type processing-associated H-X9-DG protein
LFVANGKTPSVITRSQRSAPGRRKGFTLVELLVVLAIIAVLIALLVPAVQKAREAGHRLTCLNQLKQLALACHGYHANSRAFPPGGTSTAVDRGSWLVYLLPYLEHDNLYRRVRNFPTIPDAAAAGVLPQPLPLGRCPSDPWEPGNPGYCSYVGSVGPQCDSAPLGAPNQGSCGYEPFAEYCNQPAWGYTTSADHGDTAMAAQVRGMFCRGGAKITMASVTDGLANTLLIGETTLESFFAIGWSPAAGWASTFGGNSEAFTIMPINYRIDPDDLSWCGQASGRGPAHNVWNWAVSWGFKSWHPGGANFAFADGSVHFLGEALDHRTYQLLGCRHDNQVPGAY